MDANRFCIPVEQLEDETRVPRRDQVALVADGAGPPELTSLGVGDHGADGDGE